MDAIAAGNWRDLLQGAESMKRLLLAILLVLWPAISLAQTTTTYRGMAVRTPDPTGAAGLAWQNNFKALADRLGNHIEAAVDPDSDDDSANTGGNGAVMDRSTWLNTTDRTLWYCLDASAGAAEWAPVVIDWDSIAITGGDIDGTTIGATTPAAGAFTNLSASTLTARQLSDAAGLSVYGYQDRSTSYGKIFVDANGIVRLTASGAINFLPAATAHLYFHSTSSTGSTRFFSSTTGNPELRIYGRDTTQKYGALKVDASGAFCLSSQSGEALKLYANANSTDGIEIDTDGNVHLGSDGQYFKIGAAGSNTLHSDITTGRLVFTTADDFYAPSGNWGFGTSPSSGYRVYTYSPTLVALRATSGSGRGIYASSTSAEGILAASTTGTPVSAYQTGSTTNPALLVDLANSANGATGIRVRHAGTGKLISLEQGSNEKFSVENDGATKIEARLEWAPAANDTPTNNGDLVIEATTNTSLTLKFKGSDGIVRSATLALSP